MYSNGKILSRIVLTIPQLTRKTIVLVSTLTDWKSITFIGQNVICDNFDCAAVCLHLFQEYQQHLPLLFYLI